MIALGISPGVRRLAYCVLDIRPRERQLEVLDSDLMKGGKPQPEDPEERLVQLVRPHRLVLAVVFERALDLRGKDPLIVAIGPAGKQEPELQAYIARALLTGICAELEERGVAIQCHNFQAENELDGALGVPVRKAVSRALATRGGHLIQRTPHLMMAAGTALAGAHKYQGIHVFLERARST